MPISRLPMMVCVRGVFAVCLSRIYLSWCLCMWCLCGMPHTRSLRFAYLASTCLSISAALAMSRSVCKGRTCGMRASKCLSQTLFLLWYRTIKDLCYATIKVPIPNSLFSHHLAPSSLFSHHLAPRNRHRYSTAGSRAEPCPWPNGKGKGLTKWQCAPLVSSQCAALVSWQCAPLV